MALEVTPLQQAIHAAGHTWTAITPPTTPHPLGLLPSDPAAINAATITARILLEKNVQVDPALSVLHETSLTPVQLETLKLTSTITKLNPVTLTVPAGIDWRTHNIIGPVRDQEWCGSCVSFATCGLVEAMAMKEWGLSQLVLSTADQHFCSSHGPNCGGWNNADALGQAKARGIVPEYVLPYDSAFDTPPKGNPADVPDHLWLAYARPETNRNEQRYMITDYSAWSSKMPGISIDGRKYYLSNFGPMVMGFTVYEDFDSYGGGVFKHVTGKSRGGHCVLVVGYSDADQAWICRNSWGSGFGGAAHPDGTGAGFFMIAYGDSNIDDTFYGCHGVLLPPSSRLASRVGDMDGDGHAEILVTSPWGIGIMKQAGNTMAAPIMAPNGTRFGGWLLDTSSNSFGPVADYDGDGHAEVFVVSPWGIGILKLTGSTLTSPMMAQNGTMFGSWKVDSTLDTFGPAADYDGDGHAEILVTGPSGIAILKMSGSTMTVLMAANNGTRFGGWLLETKDNAFTSAADFDGDRHAELFVLSPWGVGILKLNGNTLTPLMMAPNQTFFGGWRIDTATNSIGEAADYDGDGKAEIFVTSPWGVGILKLNGNTMASPVIQPNGTRFGGWLLETAANTFGPAADFDGDGKAELLVTSNWGVGILKEAGNTMAAPMMAQNGTRFNGGWLLNTADNRLGIAGVYAGGRQAELFVSSPWGIGILQQSGASMNVPVIQPNGTRFGGWLLNTADNHF